MTAKSVFLYPRISADQSGRREGVHAQERWGREYAGAAWPGVPIRVFCDNDLSAAKDDVVRPAFEEMRKAIRRGECAHLWTVAQARLTRIETVWFALVADLLRGGLTELHTRHDGIVRLDDVVGGLKAVLDADEVRKLRKRVTDKKEELAREGRPGGQAPFGYRQRIYTDDERARLETWQDARHAAKFTGTDMRRWNEDNPRPEGGRHVTDSQGRAAMEIVPGHAAIIRQAAEKVLSGWSLTSVTLWMRETGVRTPRGAEWAQPTVGRVLTNPALAGFRVHRGEITGPGTWEPILDEPAWRALCAVIGTQKKSAARKPRLLLLGGYRAQCECGNTRLHSASHKAGGAKREQRYYVCRKFDGGCGRVTVDARSVEQHVTTRLFARLDELDAAGLLAADDYADRRGELVTGLQALDQRRAELSSRWAARKITTEQFDIMNASVDDEQRLLGTELAGLPAPMENVDPAQLRAAWPGLTLEEKQKIIDGWVVRVVITRRTRRPAGPEDVARRAGVSLTTVNRYLRDGQKIRQSEAVDAAAAALGFTWPRVRGPRSAAFDPGRVEIIWHPRALRAVPASGRSARAGRGCVTSGSSR